MTDLPDRLESLYAQHGTNYVQEAAAEIRRLRAEVERLRADADYFKWRLKEILPLFEEARDALPAISLASAKLNNISLSLADRMNCAGTRTRQEFDAARAALGADHD